MTPQHEFYNKKILGLITVFKEWPHDFERANYTNIIFSDYKYLKYVASPKVLN
jgi:hypothetical protein